MKENVPLRTDLNYKGGMKYSGSVQWMSGLKSRLEFGDKLTASFALTSPYGRFNPDTFNYTAGLLVNFPKIRTKMIAGYFNARFGQGLILWNGLSLGSLSSPVALMKNPEHDILETLPGPDFSTGAELLFDEVYRDGAPVFWVVFMAADALKCNGSFV